jgi:hypothetical protein
LSSPEHDTAVNPYINTAISQTRLIRTEIVFVAKFIVFVNLFNSSNSIGCKDITIFRISKTKTLFLQLFIQIPLANGCAAIWVQQTAANRATSKTFVLIYTKRKIVNLMLQR